MTTHVSVSSAEVGVQQAMEFVTDEKCGAAATFVGVTRSDVVENKRVTALEFEAHVKLAESVMHQIIDEYRAKKPNLVHVFVHHRLGVVPAGEGNVVIAVSSGHRRAAFQALENIMDQLKAKLPVWKKEIYDDGSYRWLENAEFSTG